MAFVNSHLAARADEKRLQARNLNVKTIVENTCLGHRPFRGQKPVGFLDQVKLMYCVQCTVYCVQCTVYGVGFRCVPLAWYYGPYYSLSSRWRRMSQSKALSPHLTVCLFTRAFPLTLPPLPLSPFLSLSFSPSLTTVQRILVRRPELPCEQDPGGNSKAGRSQRPWFAPRRGSACLGDGGGESVSRVRQSTTCFNGCRPLVPLVLLVPLWYCWY